MYLINEPYVIICISLANYYYYISLEKKYYKASDPVEKDRLILLRYVKKILKLKGHKFIFYYSTKTIKISTFLTIYSGTDFENLKFYKLLITYHQIITDFFF